MLNILNLIPQAAATNYGSSPADALALICPFGLFGGFYVVILCIQLIALLFGAFALVVWIWMLIDLLQRDAKDFPVGTGSDPKVLWILVVLLTGWIGGLIYYLMVYRKMQVKKK